MAKRIAIGALAVMLVACGGNSTHVALVTSPAPAAAYGLEAVQSFVRGNRARLPLMGARISGRITGMVHRAV
jgi:hypothetical protein